MILKWSRPDTTLFMDLALNCPHKSHTCRPRSLGQHSTRSVLHSKFSAFLNLAHCSSYVIICFRVDLFLSQKQIKSKLSTPREHSSDQTDYHKPICDPHVSAIAKTAQKSKYERNDVHVVKYPSHLPFSFVLLDINALHNHLCLWWKKHKTSIL